MSNLQHRRSRGTPTIVYVARYLSGRDLDGQRRSNATFLRHADRDLTPHGRASRWAHRRHADRAAIRIVALAAVLAFAWGYVTHRTATLLTALGVTVGGATFAAWRVTLAIMRAKHDYRVVKPLYMTLAHHAYHAPGDSFKRHLTVPLDYASNPNAVVRLMLSPRWEGTDAQRKLITSVARNRLGGDWLAEFKQDHYPPYVQWRKLPEPPGRLLLADFIPRIDSLPESVLGLGFGASHDVISVNLDSDAPHIALSMGTGGGKTDTVALIVAQLVRKGCERIDIIDPKKVSHRWAQGLPCVHIQKYVNGQMEAISETRRIMDDRYEAMDREDCPAFPRRVLIIEEQNSLMQDLADMWDEYRRDLTSQERGQVSRKNPAIADLRYILNKGRQCRINVISIYQRMSAKAAGDGDMRDQYGCKILARYSPQTWRMLVGTTPVPRPSRIPGRAMIVIGDEHRSVQRAYAGISKPDGSADREGIARIRAFALNGREDTKRPALVSDMSALPVTDAGNEIEASALITLREACESGLVRGRYESVRRSVSRDPAFPAGIKRGPAKFYLAAELSEWNNNRVS